MRIQATKPLIEAVKKIGTGTSQLLESRKNPRVRSEPDPFFHSLFAWDCLEDSPTLKTIKQLLELIPDEKLLVSLEEARGKGRNDDSLHTLWGVLVLSSALRHPTIEACLAELRRNSQSRHSNLETGARVLRFRIQVYLFVTRTRFQL